MLRLTKGLLLASNRCGSDCPGRLRLEFFSRGVNDGRIGYWAYARLLFHARPPNESAILGLVVHPSSNPGSECPAKHFRGDGRIYK